MKVKSDYKIPEVYLIISKINGCDECSDEIYVDYIHSVWFSLESAELYMNSMKAALSTARNNYPIVLHKYVYSYDLGKERFGMNDVKDKQIKDYMTTMWDKSYKGGDSGQYFITSAPLMDFKVDNKDES